MKDSYVIENGICFASFNEAGELTKERVSKIFDILAVKFCDVIEVEVGGEVSAIGESAFRLCLKLQSMYIMDSVTVIGKDALYGCQRLKYLEISSGVTKICSGAFSGCVSLKSVRIPESVTQIDGSTFKFCHGLEAITVDKYNKAYKSVDGALYTKDGKTIVRYPLSKKETFFAIPEGVEEIGDFAFFRCAELEAVEIPTTVGTIGQLAFSDCKSLKAIDIPQSVSQIGEEAFSRCNEITSVTIPKSVTSIGSGAFCDCEALESINVDEENRVYKSKDGCLYSKDGQIFFQYPKGKKDSDFVIPQGVSVIGECAFLDCQNLINLEIPDSLTAIGKEAFVRCAALTEINMPQGMLSIGKCAFSDCYSLMTMFIPKTVTTVGEHLFFGCYALTIFVEAEEKPEGWHEEWNHANCLVFWNSDKPQPI